MAIEVRIPTILRTYTGPSLFPWSLVETST